MAQALFQVCPSPPGICRTFVILLVPVGGICQKTSTWWGGRGVFGNSSRSCETLFLFQYFTLTADTSARLSPLRNVSRGGKSAAQRQKFQSDDTKSVQSLVRRANWLTEWLHCFSFCLWMTDKRQKAAKVKCKCNESLTKQSIFVEWGSLL